MLCMHETYQVLVRDEVPVGLMSTAGVLPVIIKLYLTPSIQYFFTLDIQPTSALFSILRASSGVESPPLEECNRRDSLTDTR